MKVLSCISWYQKYQSPITDDWPCHMSGIQPSAFKKRQSFVWRKRKCRAQNLDFSPISSKKPSYIHIHHTLKSLKHMCNLWNIKKLLSQIKARKIKGLGCSEAETESPRRSLSSKFERPCTIASVSALFLSFVGWRIRSAKGTTWILAPNYLVQNLWNHWIRRS